jgi:HD domain.
VQAAADAGASLAVRLAALFHDLGKPHVAWRGTDGRLHYYAKSGYSHRSHEQVSATLAGEALRRLRYPNALRDASYGSSAITCSSRARRIRSVHGASSRGTATSSLSTCSRTSRPTCSGSAAPTASRRRRRSSSGSRASARSSGRSGRARTGSDLAIGGDDLIAAGFAPGPRLGQVLQELLDSVVDNPALNTRDELLRRARKLR